MWQDTLDAEFGGGKFKRLFRGPMWSGCERKDMGDPRKVIKSYSLTFNFTYKMCLISRKVTLYTVLSGQLCWDYILIVFTEKGV